MVGKNIKKAREEKGLTQDALAEQLNVTRQAVSNWENEKTQPDIETLDQIAQILGVDIERLIYGQERKFTIEKHYHTEKSVEGGVTFGAVLAMVISYAKWESIGWAILHGALNWIYVIYYIIKYGWS
ncbi:MAG: helix-turn-helix transcriptional regulator [Clostridia bacterium]|nr:helix-turn-helix transcriptional regulator [Clostridia bacterium]